MKKYILLFILVLFLTSCSQSGENFDYGIDNVIQSKMLIKKAVGSTFAPGSTAASSEASARLLFEIEKHLRDIKQQNEELLKTLKEKRQ